MISKVLKFLLFVTVSTIQLKAQNVIVDVNVNIKHSVNGVSEFHRDKYINVHSSIEDAEWIGEEEKMKYLFSDLDVYFGRDISKASQFFYSTPQDSIIENYPDIDSMTGLGLYFKESYENLNQRIRSYEYKSAGMVEGTKPRPIYPTLCYYGDCFTRTTPPWQPKNIQTSADWVVEYLDKYFAKSVRWPGAKLPKYWEVINEPDMALNTANLMMSSWEDIWEYHRLVANGVRERLGENAPLIGGMTWGLQDLYQSDLLIRYKKDYIDAFYGSSDEEIEAAAYARAQIESDYWPEGISNSWYQWDVIYKGFIDAVGGSMDFYSLHIYDWPGLDATGSTIRRGGHIEAMLDMLEWYDVYIHGKDNRKPIVVSEFGAIQGAWNYKPHKAIYDWECMKSFSAMLMQFMERPDYIVKTIPYTPIKAKWGDMDQNGDQITDYFYPYKLLRDDDDNDEWEWSHYIKWYELWGAVKGTRVDTRSTDRDIQVDAYANRKHLYLVLNNLEPNEKLIDLGLYGCDVSKVLRVEAKHLYFNDKLEPHPELSITNYYAAPTTVVLAPEATMILDFVFPESIIVNETNEEVKYYGESLNGYVPHRKTVDFSELTASINNVSISSGHKEAVLRIGGKFYQNRIDNQDNIISILFNGNQLEINADWRGEYQGSGSEYFGVLEIEVPGEYLQENNVVKCTIADLCEYTNVSLQVFNYSAQPIRTDTSIVVELERIDIPREIDTVEVNGNIGIPVQFIPDSASNKLINWHSSDTTIAIVNANGVVTGMNVGTAILTAFSYDSTISAQCFIYVLESINVPVEELTITPGTIEIFEGGMVVLSESIQPYNATKKRVIWSSGNESVATVDSTGTIRGIEKGSTIIYAASEDGGKVDSSIVIVDYNTFEFLTVSPKIDSIWINDSVQLQYWASSLYADSLINWSSKYDSIATIDTLGLVTGIEEGKAVLYAYTSDSVLMDSSVIWVNEKHVEGVAFEYDTITVSDSAKFLLEPFITPYDATNKKVTWQSSNSQVATVNENGFVECQENGLAVISATTIDGQYTAEVVFNVLETYYAVEDINILQETDSIYIGSSITLGYEIYPEYATNQIVAWCSTDTLIARIDNNGTVNGVGQGSVYLIAAVIADNIKDSILLEVCPIEVESIGLSSAKDTIRVDEHISIEADIMPSDATNKNVIWDVSDPSIASINNTGLVLGKRYGRVMVKATTEDGGYSDSLEITVYTPVESIKIGQGLHNILMNDQKKLDVIILPNESSIKDHNWSSANKDIADIDSLGVVTGISIGTTKVYATTVDGGHMDSATVTVNPVGVDSVLITNTDVNIGLHDSTKLNFLVFPNDATNKTVSWVSDNENIAVVYEDGLVVTTGLGQTDICVITHDGNYSNCAKIEVSKVVVASLKIEPSDTTIYIGDTIKLRKKINPENATNPDFTWSSDNGVIAIGMDGTVYGLSAGTRSVTLEERNTQIIAKTKINVVHVPVKNIRVVPDSVKISIDEKFMLYGILEPKHNVERELIWSSSNDSIVSVTFEGEIKGVNPGIAFVTAQTKDLSVADFAIVIVGSPTSNDINSKINNIFVHPNPAKDRIKISNLENGTYTISVYNIHGEVLKTMDIDNPVDREIDIVNLLSGVYLIKISRGGYVAVVKFSKQ